MTGRRLLIVDPIITGHHPAYIRRIARGAIDRGYQVVIVTVEKFLATADWKSLCQHQDAEPVALRFVPEGGVPSEGDGSSTRADHLLLDQLRLWYAFRAALRAEAAPEVVVVAPYFDAVMYGCSLFGNPRRSMVWVAISMRPPVFGYATGIMGSIKRRLFERALRLPWLRVVFCNDIRVTTLAGASPKLRFLPDPIDAVVRTPRLEARTLLGLPREGFIVLVYGVITERKGVGLLLRAATRPDFPAGVHILLAGTLADDCRNRVLSALASPRLSERMSILDRVLSDDEEALVFSCSDIAWLVYQGHEGMSGVLVQAGAFALPSLVSGRGVMGMYARDHGVGLAIDPADELGAVQALQRLVADEALRNRMGERAHACFSGHTTQVFQDTLFAEIDKAVA
jgi:glycosyltransferase involved in cell wall biosynthesis